MSAEMFVAMTDLTLFLFVLQPGDFVHTLGDAHIYVNHIQPLKEQVSTSLWKLINLINFVSH